MASANDTTGLFDPLLNFDSELTAEVLADATSLPIAAIDAEALCNQNWCFPVEFVLCYRSTITEIVTLESCENNLPVFSRATDAKKFPAGSRLVFSMTANNCQRAADAAAGLVTGRLTGNVSSADVLIDFGVQSICDNILAGKRVTIKVNDEIMEGYACVNDEVVVIRGTAGTTAIGHSIGDCFEVTSIHDATTTVTTDKTDNCSCVAVVSPDCIELDLDTKGLDLGNGTLTSVLQALVCLAAENNGGGANNTVPVAPPNQAFDCEPGEVLNLTVPAAFDADGDTLTITDTAPAGVILTLNVDNTVTISGTCPAEGLYNFSIVYEDTSGATATTAVQLNSAPAAPEGPQVLGFADQTQERGDPGTYDFTACFTHPNALALTYTLVSTLPTGMAFNAATGEVSGTPVTDGVYPIVVRATDPNGLSAECIMNLTVTFTPAAPIANPPVNVFLFQNSIVFYDVSTCFTHPDGLTLTYSVVGTLPSGLSLNNVTGAITGTVDNEPLGANTFTIRATDTAGQTVDCLVPYFVGGKLTPIYFQSPENLQGVTTQAATFPFNNCFALPAGATATYAIVSGAIPGMALNAAGELVGTPTTPGTYNVVVDVTAAGSTEQCNKTIVIYAPVNALGNISDQADTIGNPILIDMSTCFESDVQLTYTAAGLPPGLQIDDEEGSISGFPTLAGAYNITVTATDEFGETAICTFAHQIDDEVISGPVNSGFPNQLFALNDPVNLDVGSAFTDPDGQTLAFTLTPLPPGMSFNSTTGILSGTATTAGTYNLTVTAQDPDGNQSFLLFEIEVI